LSAATETLVEMLKEVRERRKARREAEQPIEINPLATVTTYSSTPLGGVLKNMMIGTVGISTFRLFRTYGTPPCPSFGVE